VIVLYFTVLFFLVCMQCSPCHIQTHKDTITLTLLTDLNIESQTL